MANENTKLEKLLISNCRVETAGAVALAEYFKSYDTLQHLEIFNNNINDEGSVQLGKSLVYHGNSLKHLEINDNWFNTEDQVVALCSVIWSAKELEHLNIDGVSLASDEQQSQL